MRKSSIRVGLLVGAVVLVTGLLTQTAHADISWSGNYRIEAVKVKGAELDSTQQSKAYLLHRLVLQPKLVAADGINIYGRFDLLNDTTASDNLAGQSFGTGPSSSAGPQAGANTPSNVFSDNQDYNSPLLVTQLYATWTQEFGVFVVGRAPLRFGLGMTYSDGSGLFDHYMTSRDMIGYKAVLGNLSVMPMLAKVNEGALNDEDDVNDYILNIQYDNPETDLELGLMYQLRVATRAGNDAPNAGGAAAATEGFKSQNINLFTGQKWGNLALGLEGGFNSGDTGLKQAGGGGVKLNSYGIAANLNYANPESKWSYGTRAGIATGDDSGTPDTYEGFIFNRNYNVGMLLFNHPLGGGDHLRTSVIRDTTTSASNQIDTEAVSNTMYIAPGFQHRWKETIEWGATFVWATAQAEAYPGMAKDLGYELDLNFTYKPYEKMRWITEIGMMSPGDAWKTGGAGFDNRFTYGITTKAAITF